jgi:hypothetical protein
MLYSDLITRLEAWAANHNWTRFYADGTPTTDNSDCVIVFEAIDAIKALQQPIPGQQTGPDAVPGEHL